MKFYKTDWFLRVLSLVVAIIIWFYVVYQENPTIDTWITNIPLAQNNLSEDFENGKLIILSVSTKDVDVKMSGRRRMISSINADSGYAHMDMSKITDAGTYEIPINVDFSIDGLDTVQIRPNRCTVVVDRVVTQERPINVIRKGTVKEGYFVDSIVTTPDVIKLSGPKSALDMVSSCSITVDLTDKKDDIKGLYKVKLYDEDEVEITNTSITKNIEYTDVFCSVSESKNITITPDVSGDVNKNGDLVIVECIPDSVTLKGKTIALENTNELLTEHIDISNILETTEIECSIVLPEGLFFADEGFEKIKVRLVVEKHNTTD